MALYIVVQTGSRNEVEPGKSGFAHFFEHMMFRGSEHYTSDKEGTREAIISNRPSPIVYNSPKPKEIADEDKVIEVYKINVKPEDVVIVPVEKVFE